MKGLHILLVDNESEARRAMLDTLNPIGYSVEEASDGLEALDKFKDNDFNLVITDDRMPTMSGMELIGKIKEISPHVPVIMITGFGSVNHAVEAMKMGASDYILKPFSSEVLEKAVKKACHIGLNQKNQIKKIRQSVATSKEKKIITQNADMIDLLDMAKSVASSNATILIQGESGTGKELLAYYIHFHSGVDEAPYVAVNCAALPDTLAESELFGHEKGSFTGAIYQKKGKFELAEHGTIVLDEISEMSLPLQAKILRVLQEKQVDRVGGSQTTPMNARVIAISNKDLNSAVKKGKFREDLFYRVNVIPLRIPPLRERKDDIPILAEYFTQEYCLLNNREKVSITRAGMDRLLKYQWKGNIRELENTIERAVLIGKSNSIQPEDLLLNMQNDDQQNSHSVAMKPGMSVREMEKKLIFQTLKEVNDNRTHAAEMLGISIRTLRNKLKDYREELKQNTG